MEPSSLPEPQPVELLTGFLYLGSQRHASDLGWLAKNGIGEVLNVGHVPGRPSWALTGHGDAPEPSKSPLPLYTELHAFDDPAYPILDNHLRHVTGVLSKAAVAGRRVLINCHQGINRSAALAAAYLASATGSPVVEVISILKSRRPVLSNTGFLAQLLKWDATR